jgi:2-polyprenyl-3-methyl-5-hydroxy-6-metoxy-1,4-benzoquinol methylase
MGKVKTDWWNGFDVSFRPVFDILPGKESRAMVRYLTAKLGLRPGKKFLDCPSGPGRFAIPLAMSGVRVTGVDLIQSYLDDLQKRAGKRNLKIKTVCCDMRRINFDNEFDAGANLWTSFGYFEKESDNLLVLKKAWQALKPGGKFMVHTINRDWIMADFTTHNWFPVNENLIIIQNTFDYETSMLRSTWKFVNEGKITSHDLAIRIYTCHELRGLFERAGFTDIAGFGGMEDEPISRKNRMMFVVGTKPK